MFDNYIIQNGSRTYEWVSGTITTPASGGFTINFTYNDDLIQTYSVSAAVMMAAWRTNQGTIASNHYVSEVHATECGDANNPSCPYTAGGVVKIGLNSQQGTAMTHWKFMIAHEFGHAIQYAFSGVFEADYDWSLAPTLCTCNHVANNPYSNAHCLQSRGDIGAGELEGFAHAFSSRVFNRDNETNGLFVYYKPFLSPYVTPNQTYNPPILVWPLADNKFMSNFCGASGKGVELDWLQFFYQISALQTSNSVAIQDLLYIYRYACTNSFSSKCSSQVVTWSRLLAGAQALYGSTSDARYQTFSNTGVAAGVNW